MRFYLIRISIVQQVDLFDHFRVFRSFANSGRGPRTSSTLFAGHGTTTSVTSNLPSDNMDTTLCRYYGTRPNFTRRMNYFLIILTISILGSKNDGLPMGTRRVQ